MRLRYYTKSSDSNVFNVSSKSNPKIFCSYSVSTIVRMLTLCSIVFRCATVQINIYLNRLKALLIVWAGHQKPIPINMAWTDHIEVGKCALSPLPCKYRVNIILRGSYYARNVIFAAFYAIR